MTRAYSTRGAMRDPSVRNHFVYRLFDAEGALLYIGCSIHPLARVKEHRNMAREMVAAVARVRVAGPYNYQTARQIERAAIDAEAPRCNGDSAAARARKPHEQRLRDEVFASAVAQGVSPSRAVGMASAAVRRALVAGAFDKAAA